MKKLFLTAFAAIAISTMAFAQNNQQQFGQRPDDTEMAQKQTQNMVKTYGLDEKQEKKLLKLNQKYAGKMGPGAGMPGPGPQMKPGEGPQKDQNGNNRPPHPDSNFNGSDNQQQFQRPDNGGREDFEKRMQEGKKNMEAYQKQLKKIMTTDQYTRYESDMKKNMKRGPHNKQNNSERK